MNNDIDVSKCVFLAAGEFCNADYEENCGMVTGDICYCKSFPDCYYKQLQRKTQECEKLQERLTILDEEAVVVELTLEEYEQLQEYKKCFKKVISRIIQEHTDELLEWIIETIESVGA